MNELTLYVMNGDKTPDFERLIASFGEDISLLIDTVVQGTPLPLPTLETEWYMVLYSSEYLGKALAQVLPMFMEHAEWEYLIVYKRCGAEGDMKYSNAPRLFRKHVHLSGTSLMPEGDFKFNTILDGYIFE